MEDLVFTTEIVDGLTFVHVGGMLDSINCMEFGVNLQEIAKKENLLLLLDLEKLTYINSLGIGTVVSTIKSIQNRHGKACLFKVTDEVLHVFELTGLSTIFEFFTDKDKAIAFLKS